MLIGFRSQLLILASGQPVGIFSLIWKCAALSVRLARLRRRRRDIFGIAVAKRGLASDCLQALFKRCKSAICRAVAKICAPLPVLLFVLRMRIAERVPTNDNSECDRQRARHRPGLFPFRLRDPKLEAPPFGNGGTETIGRDRQKHAELMSAHGGKQSGSRQLSRPL